MLKKADIYIADLSVGEWILSGHTEDVVFGYHDEESAEEEQQEENTKKVKIGSLCSGIGGLDRAVEQLFDAEVAWFYENDQYANKVLAQHWPGIPNYGDLTVADWSFPCAVDIITAGYPCQPYSHAGLKLENDERIIWSHIHEAISVLRPKYVILENVAAHVNKGFAETLGSLAEIGFDAVWCCLPASDIGACHKRERLFVIASDPTRI